MFSLAATHLQVEPLDLEIRGELPEWLDGDYVRNGPGQLACAPFAKAVPWPASKLACPQGSCTAQTSSWLCHQYNALHLC